MLLRSGHFVQIRLGLEESLGYRIVSNASYDICVCSNEAKSVPFNIVPKTLGQMPLAVVAKDVNVSACGQDIQQMRLGVSDAVIRKLLVEVCLSFNKHFRFLFCFLKFCEVVWVVVVGGFSCLAVVLVRILLFKRNHLHYLPFPEFK